MLWLPIPYIERVATRYFRTYSLRSRHQHPHTFTRVCIPPLAPVAPASVLEPLTTKNQVSFNESMKAPASPYKSRTPDAGITKQNDIRSNLGLYNNQDMFVCPIEPFVAHYGPCEIKETTIDGCMARLAQDNDVLKRDEEGNYSWVDFKILPKNSSVHEDETFKPLGKIVDAVLTEKTNNLSFMLVPKKELASDIRGSTHKIDACFVDGQHTGFLLQNREIKAPVEVKKRRHIWIRRVVHLQILGACHHILNEDPRRMWIYGLTFENSMASVWYFSRSHSVKSIAFDWIQNPRMLVHILLAFAHATPTQLGVDPTVHIGPRGKNGKPISYVYEVPNEGGKPLFFKTGRSLVPQRPLCISDRTTRVWEVTQVTSADGRTEMDARKVILKDVWLDASDEYSKTEADNMDAIFKAVDDFVEAGLDVEIEYELKARPEASREKISSDPATVARLMMQFINRDPRFQAFDDATKKRLGDNLTNKKYRSMFLTKLHARKGMTSRAVGAQASRSPNLFYPKPLNDENIEREVEAEYQKDRGLGTENATVRTMNGPDNDALNDESRALDDKYRLFSPKRQSRFIYEEVCTTLQNLDTVGDVVDILCQTVDALHVLYAVGWVHRDISSNNIMAFRAGPNQAWTLKLADLEFSRLMIDKDRKPRSDPRTGTPFFMPVEILSREHLFVTYIVTVVEENNNLAHDLNIKKEDNLELYNHLSVLSELPFAASKVKIPSNPLWDQVPESSDVVNHNFQHDLESVWWILLWIITSRVNCDKSATLAERYFKHDVNQFDSRRDLLHNPMFKVQRSLDVKLKDFGTWVENLRRELLQHYITRCIFGQLKVPESYSAIHAAFATRFREMQANQGPWRMMELQRMKKASEDEPGAPPTVTGKRERDASEAEPRGSTRKLKLNSQA